MVLRYETFSSAPGVAYYQSFGGYHIPPKPRGPIPFEETARLASFYLARHEKAGRLLWFAKILVEKVPDGHWQPPEALPPGAHCFLDVVVGSAGIEPGPPIDYQATNHRADYLTVEAGPDGLPGQAELLHRKVFFADLYLYRPNGKLRLRKLVRTDEGFSLWHYDDRGNVVAQLEESSGGFSPAERDLMGIQDDTGDRLDDDTIRQVMAHFLEGLTRRRRPAGANEVVRLMQGEFERCGKDFDEQVVRELLSRELRGQRRWGTDYRAALDWLRSFLEDDARKQDRGPTDFLGHSL